jgi:CRP/FNR family transcriptional regulator, cyclic AMP receptor protein
MHASPPTEAKYNITYEPNAALEFFKLFGKSESAKQDEIIFSQGQKANRLLLQHDKMYLLVKGTVNIQVASEIIASVKPGDIFGELTPLILSVRSATAIADVPCRLLSLSEKQLRAGLKEKPEFALMLMSLFVRYLRQAVIEKKSFSVAAEIKNNKKSSVLNSKIIAELVKKFGNDSMINVPQQRVIFQEGGTGMLMYVIIEGYVAASIGNKVVERSGAGGVIGEIALIDQKRRIAKVVAETNCVLLAFNRQMFLTQVKEQPIFAISLLRALASRLYLCRTGHAYVPPSPSLFDGF